METGNFRSEKLFQGYVLAGGKSRRMGTDKAFLEFGGITFLEHAVNSLSTVCGNVKIVINDSEIEPKIKKLLPKNKCLHDVFKNRGALGGIHAALQDCESRFAIILACDLPLVEAKIIENLAKIAANKSETTSAIVPLQSDGTLQTLCAIYRKDHCLAALERLLRTQNSVSVKDLIANVSHICVSCADLSDSENMFLNINDKNDLVTLQAI